MTFDRRRTRGVFVLFCLFPFLFSVSTATAQHLAPSAKNYMIVRTPGGVPVVTEITMGNTVIAPDSVPPDAPPAVRVHRAIDRARSTKPSNEPITVLVTLREKRPHPVLPHLRIDLPRSAGENLRIVEQRQQILRNFGELRRADHRAKLASLGTDFEWRESFTAANSMTVATTVGALDRLLADNDVQFVEPVHGNEPPPTSTTSTGRTWMGTDFWAYYVFNLSGNRDASWLRVGLLDTGVRSTHTLLANRIGYARDCVRGTSNYCQSGTNLDPADHLDHGTASAAIIGGTANLGDAYKGVSFYKINSYKVYDDTSGGLNNDAVLRAFAAAEASGDEVIVANMQGMTSTGGAITSAADAAATQYGISVVAQSQGPTPDGRIKPDILAPSGIDTAGDTSDTAIDSFGGTSCAAAFGGGLAAVMYNMNYDSWWDGGMRLDSPGWLYTMALMEGERDYYFPSFAATSPTAGVGRVKLPTTWCENANGGTLGAVTITPTNTSFEVTVPDDSETCGPRTQIDAVIRWVEFAEYPHQRFQLFLYDASNNVLAQSTHETSVFQKIRYKNPSGLTAGPYKIRVFAYSMPTRNIKLYFRARKSAR